MAQYRLSTEQINASFMRNQPANRANQPVNADQVLAGVGREQERAGTAGHQADHYTLSTDAERGAFAAVNQETRTNPAQEQTQPVSLEAVTGGQPVVSSLEAQTSNEKTPLAQTAAHVGHTVAGETVEMPSSVEGVLEGEPALPEKPFEASWASPNNGATQEQPLGISDRLAGF